MRNPAFAYALGMALILAGSASGWAQGVTGHSYVSGHGSGQDCTFAAPCHDLGFAITQTYPGGEVSCLDGDNSDDFGAVAIDRSITIDCAGPYVFGAFTINGAGIDVILRNMKLVDPVDGQDSVPVGIKFQNGAALHLENCRIEQYNGGYAFGGQGTIGIQFAPASGTAKLYITDSIIRNNGDAGGNTGGGIVIQPGSAAVADVSIERSKVENNVYGIWAGSAGTVNGTVADSVISGNAVWGVGAVGSKISLMIRDTTVTGNKYGLVSNSGGRILVSHSSIVLNNTGLSTSGGTLVSFKNNDVNNLTANGAFTSSIAQE